MTEKYIGNGWALYFANEDIKKVTEKTGLTGLKVYKELTKSYVVNISSGEYKRLQADWNFSM